MYKGLLWLGAWSLLLLPLLLLLLLPAWGGDDSDMMSDCTIVSGLYTSVYLLFFLIMSVIYTPVRICMHAIWKSDLGPIYNIW